MGHGDDGLFTNTWLRVRGAWRQCVIYQHLAEGTWGMETIGYLPTLGRGYVGPGKSGIFPHKWVGIHGASGQWDISEKFKKMDNYLFFTENVTICDKRSNFII